MTTGTRRLAILALVASTLLAGCHLGAREPVQRWTGVVADLRTQWSAEPGIDVLTGAAVPIRAYFESAWLAQSMGNLDYAYPGFTDAVPDNAPADGPDLGAHYRRPSVERSLTSPLIGTDRYHLLSVQRSARNVTATVCNYTFGIASEQANGSVTSVAQVGGDVAGVVVQRLALVAPDSASGDLPPQTGPQPAPTNDVFGGWQVVGLLNFLAAEKPTFAAQWPTYRADQLSCVAKAPESPGRRAFLINGEHPREDFPTSPASPGWPEKTD